MNLNKFSQITCNKTNLSLIALTVLGTVVLTPQSSYAQTWQLDQTFLNPTPEINDIFGVDVAISGNNVFIGASGDDTKAEDSGAAYLFDAVTGSLLQTFLNPTPRNNDLFGYSVAIVAITSSLGLSVMTREQ